MHEVFLVAQGEHGSNRSLYVHPAMEEWGLRSLNGPAGISSVQQRLRVASFRKQSRRGLCSARWHGNPSERPVQGTNDPPSGFVPSTQRIPLISSTCSLRSTDRSGTASLSHFVLYGQQDFSTHRPHDKRWIKSRVYVLSHCCTWPRNVLPLFTPPLLPATSCSLHGRSKASVRSYFLCCRD
jgi:hypothetical protein